MITGSLGKEVIIDRFWMGKEAISVERYFVVNYFQTNQKGDKHE